MPGRKVFQRIRVKARLRKYTGPRLDPLVADRQDREEVRILIERIRKMSDDELIAAIEATQEDLPKMAKSNFVLDLYDAKRMETGIAIGLQLAEARALIVEEESRPKQVSPRGFEM